MDKKFNRIKSVLAEKSKTSSWLSQELNVDPATVSNWCTNKRQPSIETLFEIAKALKVNVRELLVATEGK